MIHIAICEDNDEDLAHLRSLLCQTKILCDFTEYTSAELLLLDLESGEKHFDLFLLDIFLPGRNGVETARRIRELDEKAVLNFRPGGNAAYHTPRAEYHAPPCRHCLYRQF